MDTPYQWTKQVASHWGGTRNGTIVHWPERHQGRGRGARAVQPRDRRRGDGARRGRPARADVRPRRPADAAARREHGPTFDDAGGARAPRDAVLRDVRQPRHLPQGLDRGHPPQHPVGARPRCRPIDDDVWELYAPDDWTQAHDLAAEQPERLARAPAAVPDRGGQATTSCRSTTAASSASTPTSPAARSSIRGKSQLLFGGMGRLSENSVLVIKNKSHAVTAQIEVPEGGARGRDRRPGRRLRRLEPLPPRGPPGLLLQPLRPPAVQGLRRAARRPPASTRSGWSSPTTAAASPRAATSRSTSTATRSARAASSTPCRWSSRPTRPLDVGRDSATPVSDDHGPRTTAFTGRVRWVQIDIDEAAEDLDHLITAGGAPARRDGPAVGMAEALAHERRSVLRDMVPIPGGEFLMGSERFYPEERPARASQSTVSGSIGARSRSRSSVASWMRPAMSRSPSAQLDPADFPGADPALLVPGSLVFQKTRTGRSTSATSSSGGTTSPAPPGATGPTTTRSPTWRSRTPRPTPPGPARSCLPRPNGNARPAAGSRTRPSRGVRAVFPAATSTLPAGGRWPIPGRASSRGRTCAGRLRGNLPGRRLPPNGYGLLDVTGNVWEWTADFFAVRGPGASAKPCCVPGTRAAPLPRRVIKGGSHLCAPNYCSALPALGAPGRGSGHVDPAHRLPLHPALTLAPARGAGAHPVRLLACLLVPDPPPA